MAQAPYQSYSNILSLLQEDALSRKDVYTELMKKEKKVLDTVNRVVNQDNENTKESLLFINLSISDLIARFAYNWQNIFQELIIDKKFADLPLILFDKERKFYVGIMLLIVAFILLMSY